MRRLLPPVTFLLFVLTLEAGAHFSIIPSTNEVADWIVVVIATAGLLGIFVFSIFEHSVGINVYFPGALVILLGMSSTTENAALVFPTFLSIVAGQFIGYSISFFLGRYFDFSVMLQLNGTIVGQRQAVRAISFLTFAHPHSGAITAYSQGTSGRSYRSFIKTLLPTLLFWSVLWASVAYFGLLSIVNEAGWDVVFFSYLTIWIGYVLFDHFLRNPD